MSYFVLARKYRPQSFDDLIGQEPIAKTLVNALTQGKVAHAYLFSGPRGVGKTTTARLLARSLNCKGGPAAKSCGECPSCQEIAAGTSVEDVLEIDAASNRGIDDIRGLRENVKYAPVRSRFRIYIIDEAHQITKEGFNALLKTLEEPPSYTVFMLATTEAHKMPPTILSRCQRFTLRPIPTGLMTERLEWIARKENLGVDRQALEEIVRAAAGSMRDALSLLDQAVMFAPQGVGRDAVRELLGLLPKEAVDSFLNVVKGGDPRAVVLEVVKYLQQGGDLSQLARDLQERYHVILQAKAGLQDLTGEDLQELARRAQSFSFEELERNIRMLGRCLEEMKRSPSPQAVFEVFCLRLSQPGVDTQALLRRLEVLERLVSGKPPQPVSPVKSAVPEIPKPVQPIVKLPVVEPSSPSSLPSPSEGRRDKKTPSPIEGPEIEQVDKPEISEELLKTHWPFIVQEIHKARASLAVCLEDADVHMAPNGVLELTFSRVFNMEQVARKQEYLLAAIWDRLSKKPSSIVVRVSAKPQGQPPGAPRMTDEIVDPEAVQPPPPGESFSVQGEVSAGDLPPVDEDPWVKKVLGHFPGDVTPLDPGKK